MFRNETAASASIPRPVLRLAIAAGPNFQPMLNTLMSSLNGFGATGVSDLSQNGIGWT
jgi:hypothetical protein